jgi:hypothetical protein
VKKKQLDQHRIFLLLMMLVHFTFNGLTDKNRSEHSKNERL